MKAQSKVLSHPLSKTIHSFRPAHGVIDIAATSEKDAEKKLNKALADKRLENILKEYDIEIDWLDTDYIGETPL